MAEPKLQIEQRLDRQEKAILTLAEWIEQAGSDSDHNVDEIQSILDGSSTEIVDRQGPHGEDQGLSNL